MTLEQADTIIELLKSIKVAASLAVLILGIITGILMGRMTGSKGRL